MSGNGAERQPPFSEEAERGVLGSIMLDPERVMNLCVGRQALAVDAFYVPAHRTVFEQLRAMFDARRPVDLVTVSQWLKDRALLDAAGGASAIEQLVLDTPTAAHAEHYVGIVQDKFRKRCLMERARATLEECQFGTEDAFTIASRAAGGFTDLAGENVAEVESNASVLERCLANWERAHDMRQKGEHFLPGLDTGFRRINELTGGEQPGLHMTGGKSSAGKTTFEINKLRVQLAQGIPVLLIQLDDTHDDVVGRLVSMITGVSLPALQQGFVKHDQLAAARALVKEFAKFPLHVVEQCEDIRQACALARFYKAKHKIQKVVVDYVQAVPADANVKWQEDERIKLGKIALAGKALWKELRIPVTFVSQVAKTKDYEDDGLVADMADLFGASELYHHASTVTIVKSVRNRDKRRGEGLAPVEIPFDQVGHTWRQAAAAHVVKNKHGAKGMSRFWATLKYFKFEEVPMRHHNGADLQMKWTEHMDHLLSGREGDAWDQARVARNAIENKAI